MGSLIWVAWASMACLMGQQPAPEDEVAARLLSQGQQYLQGEVWSAAAQTFHQAVLRPYSRHTTAAWYLEGLAWYYDDDTLKARETWTRFLGQYPDSRYGPEARYHLALLSLEAPWDNIRMEGVYQLLALYREVSDTELQRDIRNALYQFLFEAAPILTLRQLYLDAAPGERAVYLEPLAYRLTDLGARDLAAELYAAYIQEGGNETPYLARIFDNGVREVYQDTAAVRIALVLPLFLEQAMQTDTIPAQSRLGLAYYEGFRMALQTYGTATGRRWYVQVYDSRRDTLALRGIMRQMSEYKPDIVLGDIYPSETRMLADWSVEQRIPLMVPISPLAELCAGRPSVLLAHPPATQHGTVLAAYAYRHLHATRVAIWTDRKSVTEALASAFSETLDSLGGTSIRVVLDSVYSPAMTRQITQGILRMRQQGINAVYLPFMNSQETANLVLTQLLKENMPLVYLGSPHWWQRYTLVDRSLKESARLHITSAFMPDPADPAYKTYQTAFTLMYQMPPGEYHMQGYDTGTFLLRALDTWDTGREELITCLRRQPVFHGLHLDYWFEDSQLNQAVHIGVFKDGAMVRVPQVYPAGPSPVLPSKY
ncbi:MAG: ABC transporter substrate-binding protein [Bacteroidia bacterium]|nr:ABC transporter substrate-binding protein [Bacteroidia bacterium]